mgnify:FL=1
MSCSIDIHKSATITGPIKRLGLGVFDGYHLGHQAIGKQADALLTFHPHPAIVLQKKSDLKYLSTTDELRALYPNLLSLTFNEALSKLDPEDFLNTVIMSNIRPEELVVGHDFRFGYKGKGTASLLKDWGLSCGIQVHVVDEVSYQGRAVHSSLIRDELQHGDVNVAIALLGHPYLIQAPVIKGEQRGTALGFPTANLDISPSKCLPKPGVYKGRVELPGNTHKAMIYIGSKPTFQGKLPSVEVHLLEFNADLYGQRLSVHISKRLRDEQSFESKEALIKQIEADIGVAYD